MDKKTFTVSNNGQLRDTAENVLTIAQKARSGNKGNVYVGESGVTVDDGWELTPGEPTVDNYDDYEGGGSQIMSAFYVAFAVAGDKLDVSVIIR